MKPVTLEQIKADLETAVYVERLMPPVQFPKYRGFWPEVVYTPQEIALMDRRPVPPHPTQEQIAIWEKVILQWMPLLDVEERKLVWKRAAHIPWKLLCIEFGWHRSKLNEKYNVAISRIQGFLSGQKSRGHFRKKQL